MSERTLQDLKQKQALPLSVKILLTKARIREWVNEWGEEGVYISFSGGKDSTALLHIAREDYPNMKAVFVNTGLEYPEIVEFVKTFDNVDILKPKMNFKQVIEKYGYPMFGKEISEAIDATKKYLREYERRNKILTEKQTDRQTDRAITGSWSLADMIGIGRREKDYSEEYELLKTGNIPSLPIRIHQVAGDFKNREVEISSSYNKSRFLFMLDAPFEVSNRCCGIMKKTPAHEYGKETGRKPIIATLAEESRLRTSQWIKRGCNGFDQKYPTSNPLSFWTEQDILRYLKENNIPIASVYGDIVIDYEAEEQLKGQMSLSDFGFMPDARPLRTTGCNRTGCIFCGFGCHLEKPGEGRFERLKVTHPKIYDYIMRPKEQGGLNYKEIIEWINEHGDMNIRY